MAAAASGSSRSGLDFHDKQGRNLHPFLFVGCWNLRGAARDAVVDAMVTKAQGEGIQNIVLGGDNVYPLDEDDAAVKAYKKANVKVGPKPQKHRPEVFLEGMEKFNPFFVTLALGNHNVENAHVKNLEMTFLPVNNTYFLQEFNDAALVVFDANILRSDHRYLDMMKWLHSVVEYLDSKKKPYYFVTHEPFGSVKKHKTTIWGIGKDFMKNAAAIEAGETPEVLKELQTYPPVTVLCADTHHYEEGVIEGGRSPIHQIIVGSGGASFNAYTTPAEPFSLGDVFVYRMISDPIEMYGFLSVPSEGRFEFIPIRSWSEGGARGQTRRGRRAHKKMTRRGRRH